MNGETNGGSIAGQALAEYGVQYMFTLCGGHISPLLIGAKENGIRVIDVRDEVSSVFAADAVSRLTGIPGVAAVTAGPGVTNTITAVKNAQMAQSPLLVFGGATATLLKGRGSLQDIDQMSLMKPITKWATSLKTVSSLASTIKNALDIATSGVPGPVFIEIPVDLLYPESIVRDWYMKESGVENPKNLGGKALQLYLRGHLYKQFHAPHVSLDLPLPSVSQLRQSSGDIEKAAALLRSAKNPALVIGSQTMVNCTDPEGLAGSVESLGIPTWLGGMARGLLGRYSDVQFRHKRSKALKEADVVIVCGFPFDFRLGYGRSISSKAKVIAANLNPKELRKNRRPELPLKMHPGDFIRELSGLVAGQIGPYPEWFQTLRDRENARNEEIAASADASKTPVDPVHFLRRLDDKMSDDAIMVVDGGDFVATASYIVRPRKPLRWLDPGVFGTLGVGGGFAVGAAACRPDAEVWLIYGDGSCAYSIAEFDTCVRHGLAPIAVIGTNGSWAQIAREQVEILGDDFGTVLRRSNYHKVVEGYGGVGLMVDDPAKIDETLDEAKKLAASGKPVVINVHIASTDFRKGSVSM